MMGHCRKVRIIKVECDEKLQGVCRQLLQADVGKQELEKEVRMKEALANLQRLFPGVFGHLPLAPTWLMIFSYLQASEAE